MKKSVFFIFAMLVVFQVSFVHAQMVTHTYDFNSLTMGNLNGQDNWTTVINSNTACTDDFTVGYNMGGNTNVPDNSLGILYNSSGGNYGRTASRTTTTAFPFSFTIGGIMEIDVDIHTACWGTFFGFGYDVNNNGYILKGQEQVTPAWETNEGGFGINLNVCNTSENYFMKPDGTKAAIVYDSLSGWNTWKIFIDLDANSGAGAVSLYAKKPGGNWISIPAVQGINLGMTPGSGDKKDPAKWTKLFLQALGGYSAFDNVSISQPNTGGLIYQYITFTNPPVNHLTTDAPFTVHAISSKSLPVSCSISGPATLVGDTLITLTGSAGVVTIVGSQAGNATIAPATNDTITFNVFDPSTVVPQLDIKNPVVGNVVRAPHLDAIPISVATSIDHTDLLHVSQVSLLINSQTIIAKPTTSGYYIGYWTPPAFGTYTVTATAVSSTGVTNSQSVTFQVVPDSAAINYIVIDTLHFANVPGNLLDTTLIFPSFTGIYPKITAILKYDCPPEGCEAWDTDGHINIRGANGGWVELMRYITPYALACGDSLDVTDFASQLQGKIDVSINFPAASKVTITLKYYAGTPTYKYSWMDKLWLGSYAFGTWTTGGVALQPVEVRQLNLGDTNINSAILRVVSTGHSGPNNTSNAAEFYEAIHHFKINGATAFSQDLWRTCNPNPTGCSPQSGTWQYSRAGWCPGSIPMLWRYNMSSNIGQNISLMYEFAPTYVDLCSLFNPACVTSSSCDCSNTENPLIRVAGELITFSNTIPNITGISTSVNYSQDFFKLNVYPNPSSKGIFNLTAGRRFNGNADVRVYNLQGVLLNEFNWTGEDTTINLSNLSKGVYIMKVNSVNGFETRKLIIQ
ncbi:MAG: peptide-N-glycosidase F-related protein [Bacteroidota bacterium]